MKDMKEALEQARQRFYKVTDWISEFSFCPAQNVYFTAVLVSPVVQSSE